MLLAVVVLFFQNLSPSPNEKMNNSLSVSVSGCVSHWPSRRGRTTSDVASEYEGFRAFRAGDIVQLGGMRERSRRCQRTLGLSVADLALQLKLERPHPSLPLPFSSFLTGASPGLKISSEQQAEPLKGVWTEAESPAGSRDPDRPLTLPQKKKLTGSASVPGTLSGKSGVDMSTLLQCTCSLFSFPPFPSFTPIAFPSLLSPPLPLSLVPSLLFPSPPPSLVQLGGLGKRSKLLQRVQGGDQTTHRDHFDSEKHV